VTDPGDLRRNYIGGFLSSIVVGKTQYQTMCSPNLHLSVFLQKIMQQQRL
jgi:hypothetical protein